MHTVCPLAHRLMNAGAPYDCVLLLVYADVLQNLSENFLIPPLRRRWHSGKGLGFAGGLRARNPIPLKIRRVWGLMQDKSYVVAKRPPVSVAWKFVDRSASSVSSSASDRGSKLRSPSKIVFVLLQKGTLI
ncbi:hypothetical protein AVEN_86382-1 [Araneus ventricosus]|uniref:Uncharacterized protein n=1 Tax=Araneus ventricosus TaxID=182803 RepID=A0A4Y2LNK2_ARAVE|nr:hypothetical protein AVEN_44272-1 [Araneus ventricosus]GBN16290.1 hypothetical protein AVEN_75185-1 [Araneus ventricosus]GBN16293.1 hypothetical protein AVEN_219847-1 [Araneus ventricosus]GBN16298.1 hypothetical protein AVEN_86382-1 [Araneus ventricosus]